MIEGKLRAWTEKSSERDGVTAAYVGVAADAESVLQRAPATRLCASCAEARRWVEDEARAIGVPIEWAH